jgi:AbrB family looped-hinge helix DNA binding protein
MDLTIDKFGRVVIPKKIRERLGLKPGTTLRLDIERQPDGEQLSLRPLRAEEELKREGSLLVHTGELTDKAGNVVKQDRDRRDRSLMGA